MKEKDFWLYCLDWLALNNQFVMQLLKALVPVLALCVALVALYVVCRGAK